MRLIECYIENFGKISKQKFTFTDGFNCICQNNGEGKTTLTVFIKVMLFGMSDTKRTQLSENERRHYMPWQGGVCGGYLTLSTNGGTYRIERTFSAKASEDTYKRTDLATGAVCDDESDSFGKELFGIDAEAFERTVFHSERNLSAKTDNKTISAKLSDLVGTDGDIGVMDEAHKRLEEKRRFYQKRGGGGKIADLRAAISDTELNISEISRLEDELARLDAEHDAISAEMSELEARSKQLITERANALVMQTRASSAVRYGELQARADELSRKKDEIISFFAGHVPNVEDVEKAALYHERAEQLYEKIREMSADTEEYSELHEMFCAKITPDEISAVRAARSRIAARDARLESLKASRFGEVFRSRIPANAEIDKAISSATAKKRARGVLPLAVLLTLGLALAVAGYFTTPVLYIAGAASAVLGAIIFAALTAKESSSVRARRNEAVAFVSSVMGRAPDDGSLSELLLEMRSLIVQAPDPKEGIPDAALMMKFTSLFGGAHGVDEILEKYDRYERLTVKKALIEESLRKERSEADRLMLISRAFLAKYRTETDKPFDEIRERLKQYSELTSEIITSRARLEGLKLPSIESSSEKEAMTIEQIDAAGRAVDERRAELERTRGAIIKRRSECEYALLDKDSLTAQLTELRESCADAEDALRVVLLTQKYLKAAGDSITSKYLGKTKESFIKYLDAFGAETETDFDMDTTFGVTRIDHGAARPMEAYSKGTRELYNIAARMAVCDSLYGDELPFLIFDDPFTSLDDARVRACLSLLRKIAEKRQVIYLTCSVSRAINT